MDCPCGGNCACGVPEEPILIRFDFHGISGEVEKYSAEAPASELVVFDKGWEETDGTT